MRSYFSLVARCSSSASNIAFSKRRLCLRAVLPQSPRVLCVEARQESRMKIRCGKASRLVANRTQKMFVSTRTSVRDIAPSTGRSAASGEVGLLSEEASQRLLSVFSEAGSICLRQIHDLCAAHAEKKQAALLSVGLDLVLKWDAEVIHEETVRLETAYPEVPTLHSYIYLWLLDKLCSADKDIGSLSIPPVNEAYAGFMKRLVSHADVRAGTSFAEGPELYRRTVHVECFRGAYHDLLQRRRLWSTHSASATPLRPLPVGAVPLVAPEEAASHVCGSAPQRAVQPYGDEDTGGASKVSARSGSALRCAMQMGHPPIAGSESSEPPNVFALRTPLIPNHVSGLSEVAPPSTQSLQTKAITVTGPCFFGNEISHA